MPVYQYRCKSCGKTHDIEHGFNDERPTKCTSCGGQLVRVFHPVGVVFKGSGFHKTDYTSSGLRKESAATSASSEPAKSDGKATDTKQTDTKQTDTKQTDTKSAAPRTESPPSTSAKTSSKGGDSSSASGSTKP
jgi:putative FmdB family regulatory protein